VKNTSTARADQGSYRRASVLPTAAACSWDHWLTDQDDPEKRMPTREQFVDTFRGDLRAASRSVNLSGLTLQFGRRN
jgi:hypothetical protein